MPTAISMSTPSPGGELQREMAFRFGINLVMYALTGNYKTDVVHAPALLQRLGDETRPAMTRLAFAPVIPLESWWRWSPWRC